MENVNNNLDELLVLYALGDLEPDEALAVEEELQKRPELAEKVEKIRRTDGLLSDVFAQSDAAAQEELSKESVKPKIADKSEKTHRLARRFAFASAALALFFVVVALLYPQLTSKDVHVAMTPNETVEDKSVPAHFETKGIKQEEPASEAEDASASEEVQEETPLFAINAMDDAEVAAEDVEEEADEAIPPAAAAADADWAEDEDMPDFDPVNAPAPAAAPPMEENVPLGDAPAVRNAMESPEPEEAHAEYSMRNALYDVPSQKTAEGMAPIKGVVPPMNQELLPEEALGEMAVDQMNKQLKARRSEKFIKKSSDQDSSRSFSGAKRSAPVKDSYATLRKCVLEENRFPNPESVNVEQWLNYFGVSGLVQGKSPDSANKDAQFAKAVDKFGALLINSETTNVKAFDEVLNLLKDSVGDDEKRQEFKSIVEKAAFLSIVERTDEF